MSWGSLGKQVMSGGRKAGQMFGDEFVRTMARDGKRITPTDVLERVWLDGAFGLFQGYMTPGDLTDKLIAGGASTIGGAGGGVLASMALPGRLKNSWLRQMTELGGGIGGDVVSQMGAEGLMKAKDLAGGGSGQSPWERLGEDQRREMEREIIARLGLPGYPQGQYDSTLQQLGLNA